MNAKRCDIILPTCGQGGFIKGCIESLVKHTKYPYRLIVIDNAVKGEMSDLLDRYSKSGSLDMVLIKPGENMGWIRSINAGLELSKDSKYVCFQNDDTVFTEGWLEELVKVFESDSNIGLANPEWERPEGSNIDTFAASLKKLSGQTIDTDWCRGHCLFMKREVINKLGGLDTAYLPGYYDDRDYSLKAIAAGYRCVKAKGAFVEHMRNVTMKSVMEKEKVLDLMERNGNTFYKRWGYPIRIAFVLKNKSGSRGILQHVCMDQNKVIVITDGERALPYEHTNMKSVELGRLLFNFKALVYILTKPSRKLQKRLDFIFTDDPAFNTLIMKFKKLISADIVFENNIEKLSETALGLISRKKEESKGSL